MATMTDQQKQDTIRWAADILKKNMKAHGTDFTDADFRRPIAWGDVLDMLVELDLLRVPDAEVEAKALAEIDRRMFQTMRRDITLGQLNVQSLVFCLAALGVIR